MSEELIELIGSDSANGRIRVRLDIELPHDRAMQILKTVHSHKDQLRKEAEKAAAKAAADAKKAAELAKKSAKAESAKAKAKAAKPEAAPSS